MRVGKTLLVLTTMGLLGMGVFTLGVKAADTANGDPFTQTSGHWSDRPLVRLIRGQIGRWMTLGSDIDLSDSQKQQIASILQSHKSEILQVVQPISQKRRSLRDAVAAPTVDEKAIRAAADDLGHALGDAAVLAAQIKQQIAPVFTDEQRQKISDFRAASDKAVDDYFAKMSSAQ